MNLYVFARLFHAVHNVFLQYQRASFTIFIKLSLLIRLMALSRDYYCYYYFGNRKGYFCRNPGFSTRDGKSYETIFLRKGELINE